MKKKILIIYITLLVLNNFCYADRSLDRSEILKVLQLLTEQPRKTWITAGSIEADHFEYKVSTGYTIESTEAVKYDGERFYWQININSRIKENNSDVNDFSSILDEDFDLAGNKERIFIWDGQSYTLYFKSGGQAIVSERSSLIPVGVNGPLTAGVIPWGYGRFTYEALAAMNSSGVEQEVDGQKQIHLTLNNQDIAEMLLVLDPAKNNAVLYYSINHGGRILITQTYENYKLVADQWLPSVITIQRYDNAKPVPEILTFDRWEFTYISPISPSLGVFQPHYINNTSVEYYSSIINEPVYYKYNSTIDIDLLVQKKFAFELSKEEAQLQNCATVAVKYVLGLLGEDVNDQQLSYLVQQHDKKTNFYELWKFAKELGFYCLATNQIDTQSLKNLQGCQCIAYLPQQKHYVVIGDVDDENVWLIDFNSRKFLYSVKIEKFISDLKDGAALLISSNTLELGENFSELSESEMRQISGGFPKYSCSDIFQTAKVQLCSPMVLGVCGSIHRVWQRCYKCQEDENGGDCFGEPAVGNLRSICIEDPNNTGSCKPNYDWIPQYIRACECTLLP